MTLDHESASPVDQHLARLLAAAALHPGLRSVLLFDATVEQIASAAKDLAELLEVATGQQVAPVWLAWYHDEDALWGWGDGLATAWGRSGLLAPPAADESWRLVVIPDLPRLPLAAQRACVQAKGTERLSVQRYGQDRQWQPRLCWLAACPHGAVGEVSPHLLDRFSLRWTRRTESRRGGVASLRRWLERRPKSRLPGLGAWTDRLRGLDAGMPRMTEPALERVERSMAAVMAPGVRSHLTLARLAIALAWLDGASEVGPEQVDLATGLLGLEPAMPAETDLPKEPEPTDEAPEDVEPGPERDVDEEEARPRLPEPQPGDKQELVEVDEDGEAAESAVVPEVEQDFEPVVTSGPWPELEAETRRELGSLRMPIVQPGRQTEGHGLAVGVRPTSDLREMALLPTLFAAAPFQKGRKKEREEEPGREALEDRFWILKEMDLRAWRRAPAAREILVLVLDTTAYGRSDWPPVLVPYVRDAYVNRSAVCVVLVGAEGAGNELRAERILARSVLVPEFQDALDCEPGRATPLADGLQLALDTLRKALQHGRGAVRKARLVVLSDGRGNVPLDVSRGEPIVGPVGARGVEDALAVAKELARLDQVETDLLDPQPRYGGHLVRALAAALGAPVLAIPRAVPAEEAA